MITIDKAIRDLQARVDGEFSIKGIDNCEDMKLGIEALKLIENRRAQGWKHVFYTLPGEAKE